MRYVSITFDDGLITGARRATEILNRHDLRATFFVVTGWVGNDSGWPIRDHSNRNRSHGTWAEWAEIAANGHEIGSHTHNHFNARGRLARLVPGLIGWELKKSAAELARNVGAAPATLSMPWNAATISSEKTARRFYRACRLGGPEIQYNALDNLKWYSLRSWAPDSDYTAGEIIDELKSIPPNHWMILQFHSLDGEGYMPITSENFDELVRFLAGHEGLRPVTIREMRERYA